jgi:hypothetical protein
MRPRSTRSRSCLALVFPRRLLLSRPHRFCPTVSLLSLTQKLRQRRDIRRDPPRLVAREQAWPPSYNRYTIRRIDTRENVKPRHLLGSPICDRMPRKSPFRIIGKSAGSTARCRCLQHLSASHRVIVFFHSWAQQDCAHWQRFRRYLLVDYPRTHGRACRRVSTQLSLHRTSVDRQAQKRASQI